MNNKLSSNLLSDSDELLKQFEKDTFLQNNFWENEILNDFSILNFPADYHQSNTGNYKYCNKYFILDSNIKEMLKQFSNEKSVGRELFFLSVFNILLSKYSGQEDILICLANRDNNSILPFRSFALKEKKFIQYLNEVKNIHSKIEKSKNHYFSQIEKVNSYKNRKKFVDEVKFYFINKSSKENILITGYDLALIANKENDELNFEISYSSDLFKTETVEKIISHFSNIIKQVLLSPLLLLSEFDLITNEEKKRILSNFNNTQAEFLDKETIYSLFEKQAEKNPDDIAVIFGSKRISYRELNEKSNILARKLINLGVKPDNIVGIMSLRSIELIIALFAVLKAGGAYLPIDPDNPLERINYILKDAGVSILLTEKQWIDKINFYGTILDISFNNKELYQGEKSNPGRIAGADNICYVIYTSGSTGMPKGVMIEHKAIINRLNWMQKMYPIGKNDVILQKTPYTFDVSVWELFWWAITGAKVCLLSPYGEKDPEQIKEVVSKEKITTIHFVPSMLGAFLDYMTITGDYKKLASLTRVFASGEALNIQHVKKFNKTIYSKFQTRLYNLYGPTEAAVDVSYFDCTEFNGRFSVPIGKPIDNIQLFIVDKDFRLLPVGVPGELCIAGVGLARGYLNRAELTEEKFVLNPFDAGKRMYRTGDLAKWSDDGNIEFLGRIDFQVKIRGYRIELGEIENCLAGYKNIKEAVVTAIDDHNGDKYLCAYITADEEYEIKDIKNYLSKKMPDYMIPAYFIKLKKLPLSSNGKVNRKVLPLPEIQIKDDSDYEEAVNDTEKKLAEIWKNLLKINQIGINDSFFTLGGHSLKVILLSVEIHKIFNKKLPLQVIFKNPTIKKLARIIENQELSSYSGISKAENKEYYSLSSAQKRLFILHQLENDKLNYHITLQFTIEGNLDELKLENAINTLIQRHESLRTSFIMVDGEPVQKIENDIKILIKKIYINDESKIDYFINDFIKSFDLGKAPLLRAMIVECAKNRHLLILDIHHIVFDAVSFSIFEKELVEVYTDKNMSALDLTYKDFSEWQKEYLKSNELLKQEKYWLELFKGELPVLELPTDYSRSYELDYEADYIRFELGKDITERLKKFSYETDCTLFMILFAVYNVWLSKLSGSEDIIAGIPIAGRNRNGVQAMIGMFVETLALRNKPLKNKKFISFLNEIKINTIDAYENQDFPFEELVDKLKIKKDSNRTFLFDTFFNYINVFEQEKNNYNNTDIKITSLELNSRSAKYDLILIVKENSGQILIDCNYRSSLYKKSTINYFINEYINLLSLIINKPESLINDFDIFSSDNLKNKKNSVECHEKFEYFKKIDINQSIVKRFEEIVVKYPENIAVKTLTTTLTYKELNKRANRIANVIISKKDKGEYLNKKERIRYSRQMLLDGWGLSSQEKLKNTTVFVAGAGGSASPLIYQLALSGIGTIIVADHDDIELSNLNRQFLHDESRLGMNKALSAKMTVERINPNVNVIAYPEKITRENIYDMVDNSAMIFDNIDNLVPKFWISECAVSKKIPHIISSMIDLNSYAAILHPPDSPCFHCIYDRKKMEEIINLEQNVKNYKRRPSPVSSSSLFVSTGFICNEAIKIILGFENPAYDKFFFFNQKASVNLTDLDAFLIISYPFSKFFNNLCSEHGFNWSDGFRGNYVEEIPLKRDPECLLCGNNGKKFDQGIVINEINKKSDSNNDNNINNILNSTDKKNEIKVKTAALLFEHDAGMIEVMIAVLKSGNIYVPLDPTYPDDRLSYMLEDSEARLIITNNKNFPKAEELVNKVNKNIDIINIDFVDKNISSENPHIDIHYSNKAYILYTSGSTGMPKGVIQNHQNVLHFIRNYTNNLHINHNDKLTLFSTYSFDAAVMDIYGALLNGAVLLPYNIKSEGFDNLSKWLKDENITIFHSIPTVYRYFIDSVAENDNFPAIRLVVMGGEAVVKKDVENYKKVFSDRCLFINGLGPTESTVTLQYFINKENEILKNSVPVGYPVDDTEVFIINENGEKARVFESGEIVYKSCHLALGYWNFPELTDKVFLPDPLTGNGRVYKSGDQGRLLPDGTIEFTGRNDFQIKINGYRIELSEIEAVIKDIAGIKEAVAAACTNEKNETFLTAYYTLKENKTFSTLEIKEVLIDKLPAFMMPSMFVELKKMPVTSTGKIDRKSLPEPFYKNDENETDETPPNEFEKKLLSAWISVFNKDRIGVNSNFFELGGNSLIVIKIQLELEKSDIHIKSADIFKYSSIRSLARYLLKQENNDSSLKQILKIEKKFGSNNKKVLDGFNPFNDIFYKRCFYNSLFPVILHLNKSIVPLLMNDIAVFEYNENVNTFFLDIDYISERDADEVMIDNGIGCYSKKASSDVINDIQKALLNERPIIISIDCFYASIREDMYKKTHWPHSWLIYGFDATEKNFFIIEQLHKNNLSYTHRVAAYDEVAAVYQGYLDNFLNIRKFNSYYEYYLISDKRSQSYLKDNLVFFKKNKSRVKYGIDKVNIYFNNLVKYFNDADNFINKTPIIIESFNEIINAKQVELYKYSNSLEKDSEPVMLLNETVNIWKDVRKKTARVMYSLKFSNDDKEFLISRFNEISLKENQLYDQFMNFALKKLYD